MLLEGKTTVRCPKKQNQEVTVSKECSVCTHFSHVTFMKMTFLVSCNYGNIPDDKSQVETKEQV